MSPDIPREFDFDIERQSSQRDKTGGINRLGKIWAFGGPTFLPLKAKARDRGPSDLATMLRYQALSSLFGLPATHMSEWEGLSVYFSHLESCFQELIHPRFDPIWSFIGRDLPSSSLEVWYWCFAVIDAYETSRDRDPSIERIYQQMASGTTTRPPSEVEKQCVLQAIFAVLCWTSGTLKPILGKRDASRLPRAIPDSEQEPILSPPSTILTAENCSNIFLSTDLRRPTSKIFYSYRLRVGNAESDQSGVVASVVNTGPAYNLGDMLYEPSLNYKSLSSIGRVRIKWVDTITAHLAFDRATRELSVYRYPSFCAARILSSHKVQILESITEKLLPSQFSTPSAKEPDSIFREVLLSYRLLFGQSHKSRKILSQILNRLSVNSGPDAQGAVEAIQEAKIDRFLETLCTEPLFTGWRFLGIRLGKNQKCALRPDLFPSSSLNIHDELIESDTYSARDDFPVFGARLLTLQHYNMRRQPSKMTDLWRDRRNPVQWYTFWAVIWVGGAGILLALLQFLTGVVQMIYAIRAAG